MINTLTLNPAIDRVIYLDNFQKNITNRARSVMDTLGGKGTHVSVNLSLMGLENCAYGVAFGSNGKRVIGILDEHHIQNRFVHRPGYETRLNYLVIEDSGDCSIIAERGVMLEADVIEQLKADMEMYIQPGDCLVLSGDASNADPLVYNKLLEALKDKNLKVFLDTSGPSLKHCLSQPLYLIKPNQDELSQICGGTITTEAETIQALEHLYENHNIEIIAVSMGGDGSLVKTAQGIYRAVSPQVRVRNTIGCGDCYLAGLVAGIHENKSIVDTLRYATAVSAATAESDLSVGFDAGRAAELMDQVTITKLK